MTSANETAAPAVSTRRAWIMLIVITMLTMAGMTVVLPILPFVVLRYVPDHGSLALWVGVLETVNALCAFLVAPLLGRLSDRYGRRPIIVIAAFGSVVGFLLFGIGGSIWMLLLGRVVQGITAGDLPALFAYLADITPAEQRAKRFGLLGALTGIGTLIGPAVGGLLASINLVLPVFVTAGIALTIAILSIFVLPESLRPENRSTQRVRLRDIHPISAFTDAFSRPALRGLLLGFVLTAIPFGFFTNNFSVLALDSIAWNATQVGLVTAAVGIVDIVIQGGLLGILLPRIGERGVIVAGITGQAVGLLALAAVASLLAQPWLFIVGTLVLAAGQGAAQATIDGVLSNSVGDDEQGWLAGATSSLQSAVGMVAPLAAGALYAGVAHSAPYWLGLAMMVAAAVVLGRARFASPSKRRAAVAADATPELVG
jgi:MFS transporter, DHA1 family, tetracycline resistance protein